MPTVEGGRGSRATGASTRRDGLVGPPSPGELLGAPDAVATAAPRAATAREAALPDHQARPGEATGPDGARRPAARAREPWERSDEAWDRLQPRGLYARRVRTPLLYGVGLALALPAALIALPVTLVNACLHGGLRRAFYLQERVGRRGRVYVIYKLRTMRDVPDAPDEHRVTRFGRFLRNTHLDELPQFLNVLRGEMSLIGPRPEMVEAERWAARAVPAFSERLVLRPGITGLAQVTQGYTSNGDRDAYRRKVKINAAYARNVTLRRDVALLVRTALWMLGRNGWHRG